MAPNRDSLLRSSDGFLTETSKWRHQCAGKANCMFSARRSTVRTSRACMRRWRASRRQSTKSYCVLLCQQYGFSTDPSVVITDFEVAVMRATTDVLHSHDAHAVCVR